MATATAAQNAPAPVTGVVPSVRVSDCAAAIETYKRAFGAEELARISLDGKRIIHAHLRINGGDFFLSDPFPENGCGLEVAAGYTLHIQVDDAENAFERAAKELEVTMPLQVMFWGDKYGQLRDSFGIRWAIGGPNR
jgi:PhnB protein